jgi:AraC family transcriptional regulator
VEIEGEGAMSFRERTIATKVVGPTTIKLNDYEWNEGDEYRWSSNVHLMTWRMFPAIVSYEARLGEMELPYGRLSFYPANTTLRTNAARVSQCGRSITFQFDPTWFAETSGLPLDADWIEAGKSLDINAVEVSELFQKIGSEIQCPRQASDRLLQALCTSIAIDVSRNLDRSHSARNRTVNSVLTGRDLQEIISHIEMNIDNYRCDLSTKQLCRHFGMSATHLRRSFRSTTGQSLQSFIADLRLAKAKSMLAGPEPIKSIAFKLGFKEASAFSYAFKLKFGRTAGEYRAMLGNIEY